MLLAAFFLFWLATDDIRFHPDEAFFATFARHAAVQGDWLLPGSLDKPPLTLYAGALALRLWGVHTDINGVLQLNPLQGEFALRIWGALLALSLVAVSGRLARQLGLSDRAAMLAMLLLGISPFTLAFGASFFMDVPMLLLVMVSGLLALQERPVWSGIAFGLAVAAKPQAVFMLPLIVMAALRHRHQILHFLAGLIVPLITLFVWDQARPETSIWLQGAANNIPGEWLADPRQWGERLMRWWEYGRWLWGDPLLTAVVLVLAVLGAIRHRWAAICLLWVIGYTVLHVALQVNIYDRYLLLVLPCLALSAAAAIDVLMRRMLWMRLLLVLLLAGLLGGATRVLDQLVPIGGVPESKRAIHVLADYLNAKPVATVIYDRWLGWELGYYMGPWTNKRRVYYPTVEELLSGALALQEIGPRYWIAPEDIEPEEWLLPLEQAGFRSHLEATVGDLRIYQLRPPQAIQNGVIFPSSALPERF